MRAGFIQPGRCIEEDEMLVWLDVGHAIRRVGRGGRFAGATGGSQDGYEQ